MLAGQHLQLAQSASDVIVDGAGAIARTATVYAIAKLVGAKIPPKGYVLILAANMALSQVLPQRQKVSGHLPAPR